MPEHEINVAAYDVTVQHFIESDALRSEHVVRVRVAGIPEPIDVPVGEYVRVRSSLSATVEHVQRRIVDDAPTGPSTQSPD